MKTMIAARYLGPYNLQPWEVPLPEIGEEEVLIEVDACGICHRRTIGTTTPAVPRTTMASL